ncbi:NAD(P)/FAD-dependent oxidoreductase [bacterium]|nr:NAD(P)/FAD-dependent oxidoreductase [bacterium]
MHFKYTVIGAGVVGLAIARALSMRCGEDNDVLVVEKEKTFGTGISSRNSEVIHAGIYYVTGSLKHRLCLQGRRLLYDYCRQKSILFNKCGKLIVATGSEEIQALEGVYKQARANVVEHVTCLTAEETLQLEPDIQVFAALYSKETGILDTHAFMQSLESDVQQHNGTVVYHSEVIGLKRTAGGFALRMHDGTEMTSTTVINSAGLHATAVAAMLGIHAETMYPCKGNYFYYNGPHRCQHLIYPVPEKKLTGLGVHTTLDLGGRLKFGPDTEYVDATDDFQVPENKTEAFYQSAKKILNNIELQHLLPDMAGIRPKLQRPEDKQIRDFYIQEEPTVSGFVNLLGIESPGLTSALAIGDYVCKDILKLK